MTRLFAVLLAAALPAFAAAARFQIGLVGDAPYTAAEEARFRKAIEAMNAEELAFVVHVGDLHGQADGKTPNPCTAEVLAGRKAMLEASRHPLIFTPGDNDWTDCHGGTPAVDPSARLAALRGAFHAEQRTLGKSTFPVRRQSEKYPENASWSRDGVLFITLHMVGSNNNLGRTPEADAEHAERNAANMAWMKLAFEQAGREKHRAVVIFTQANPFFEDRWPASRRPASRTQEAIKASGFRAFLAALELEVQFFELPVLFVHGDTHYFRVDKPLYDTAAGRILQNFTRVESFGSPYVHWVRIVVDTSKPGIFEFKPELVGE